MKKLNKSRIFTIIVALAIGLFLGWLFFNNGNNQENAQNTEQSDGEIWTCSMHPQIRKSEPGKCPLCGMDLIPVENEDSEEDDPMEIKMSPTAMQLANIQTAKITITKPVKKIRMNGKVKPDETRVYSQSTHIPGRIEKLLVNYTGESVRKGQTLAHVYSPELVTAQEELFEAYRIKNEQPGLYEAAREKLKNWKLTESQIDQIIENGKIREQFPILADVSGIVINKKVKLGDYITKGQSIYEVANLQTVWVLFDVYESDVSWVKEGSSVSFTVKSLPGVNFEGTIDFIDPVINPKTRVASARVEMKNLDNRLKPDMFVEGTIESVLNEQDQAMVIPKSAVMWTGVRSVVYVKNQKVNSVRFQMREVSLGPSLGDSYIIEEGLEIGEEIAVNGTFSIDAAAQLAGKPSMMNPEGGVVNTGHNHGNSNSHSSSDQTASIEITDKAKKALEPLLSQYLNLKDALTKDDYDMALRAAKKMDSTMSKINMGLFKGTAHNVWMKHSKVIKTNLKNAVASEDLESLRKTFKPISEQMIMVFKSFGSLNETLFVDYCPMADSDKGANWLSTSKEIRNPYFGSSMLKCGEVKDEINVNK